MRSSRVSTLPDVVAGRHERMPSREETVANSAQAGSTGMVARQARDTALITDHGPRTSR